MVLLPCIDISTVGWITPILLNMSCNPFGGALLTSFHFGCRKYIRLPLLLDLLNIRVWLIVFLYCWILCLQLWFGSLWFHLSIALGWIPRVGIKGLIVRFVVYVALDALVPLLSYIFCNVSCFIYLPYSCVYHLKIGLQVRWTWLLISL